MTRPRYALYYAPAPGTQLWSFGSSALGYDAATGARVAPLAPAGVSGEDWEAMTAQPRRYGFHATLKAPFRLADGASEDDLVAAGKAFGRGRRGFELPELAVADLEGFVALTPVEPSPALNDLAAACVSQFERFRAPPTPEESARRHAASLNDRQRASLDRWGYPHVFDDFRFHMTLTGNLTPDRIPMVAEALAALYAELGGDVPNRVDAVTLYVEETPAEGFRIVDRFVFGAG